MKIQFQTKEKSSISKRKRPLIFLLSGLLSLAALGTLIYYYPPTAQLPVLGYSLPLLPLFLLLVFLTLFSFGTFTFKNKTHGILISTFVIIYLVFRLTNLTHPFFFILLFALFLTLELFVSYRR